MSGWAEQERDGLPQAVTGTASSADGSVTVEVGMGGGLRSVRLSRQALTRGGAALAATVLEVAGRATARANQRAEFAFRGALGGQAGAVLGELGLGYDPELTEEPESGEQSHLRRGWR
jgi:hypothetical protein